MFPAKRISWIACSVALAGLLPGVALAEINKSTHLNTGGQTKVNKALAKSYQNSDGDGAKRMEAQSQVNIGSRRAGTCTMNVGTQPAGGKNSKEVIITSKEIINICK